MDYNKTLLIALAAFAFFALLAFAGAQPFGAVVSSGQSSGAGSTPGGNDSRAYAGNITETVLYGLSNTQAWQGYFGNVSGTIQLANANDQVIYNWSLASPQGEVYSSTNSTVGWGNIQCFNFTANGSLGTGGETAGGTNLGGRNLTQLETSFGIFSSDPDGVDETFKTSGPVTHNEFFTGNLNFTAGECPSARIFDNTGASVDGQFEEALLYEPSTTSLVFASILEQNTAGFDSGSHDFEAIVLENGHAGDVATTTYYFFVELE